MKQKTKLTIVLTIFIICIAIAAFAYLPTVKPRYVGTHTISQGYIKEGRYLIACGKCHPDQWSNVTNYNIHNKTSTYPAWLSRSSYYWSPCLCHGYNYAYNGSIQNIRMGSKYTNKKHRIVILRNCTDCHANIRYNKSKYFVEIYPNQTCHFVNKTIGTNRTSLYNRSRTALGVNLTTGEQY